MAVTVQFAELPSSAEMLRPLTPDEFFEFCAANPDLRVELSAEGRIQFMPPCGLDADYANGEIFRQLSNWSGADGRGRANGPNAGFTLPDGSVLSPDAAWTSKAPLAAIPREQRRRFAKLVPDFVAEVNVSQRHPWRGAGEDALLAGERRPTRLAVRSRPRNVVRLQARRASEKIAGAKRLAGEGPWDGFVLDLVPVWAG